VHCKGMKADRLLNAGQHSSSRNFTMLEETRNIKTLPITDNFPPSGISKTLRRMKKVLSAYLSGDTKCDVLNSKAKQLFSFSIQFF